MSWSEIKKVVNSDFTTPLNTRIDSKTTTLSNKIDSQTTTLANKFGLTFESTNAYSIKAGTYTSWVPSKNGIIVAAVDSGACKIGLSAQSDGFANIKNHIINLNGTSSNGNQLSGLAVVKGGTTLYLMGTFQLTYYSLGGAFRKCFENLIANILLKKGGVLA